MKQHSKLRSIFDHLYPGVIIAIFFGLITPYMVRSGLPQQLSMLIAIVVVVVPVFLLHLNRAKRAEGLDRIGDLVVYREELSIKKLLPYTTGSILFAFSLEEIERSVLAGAILAGVARTR